MCGDLFYVRRGRIDTAKYCSDVCRLSVPFTESRRRKISNASTQKFIDNPHLREISAHNGKRTMRKLNADGMGWRMPIGYHSEAHKRRMSDLMRGRKVTWGDKIKDNHWAYSSKREYVISKIMKSRESSSYFQSNEFKQKLMKWSMTNIEKMTSHFRRGEILNRTTGNLEWYRSGLEERFMILLNEKRDVVYWTTKHGISIPYIDHIEKERKYYPDFIVRYDDGRIELVETKGWIRDIKLYTFKCEAGKQYCKCNNMKYIVVFKKDLDDGAYR